MLTGVTQSGSNQVVMTFKAPAVTDFYYIADQTASSTSNLVEGHATRCTYPDKNPIGTGAYTVTADLQPAEHQVPRPTRTTGSPACRRSSTVNYPAFLTNDTANTYLANGQAQWGSQFIPSIQSFYLVQEPELPLLVPAGGERDGRSST